MWSSSNSFVFGGGSVRSIDRSESSSLLIPPMMPRSRIVDPKWIGVVKFSVVFFRIPKTIARFMSRRAGRGLIRDTCDGASMTNQLSFHFDE